MEPEYKQMSDMSFKPKPQQSQSQAPNSQNDDNEEEIVQRSASQGQQLQIKLEDLDERAISLDIGKEQLTLHRETINLKETDTIVHIDETVEKGHKLNKQLFYRVVGSDRHGPFDIYRRFEEFESLRRILLERWPGCFVPALSQRSDAKYDDIQDTHRKRNLEEFIKNMSYREQIYYKEEIQLFLRGFGLDMEEMFSQMPVLRVKDVIERLKDGFGEIVEVPNNSQNLAKIKKFSTSLKKIVSSLSSLSKRVRKLAESYEVYQRSLPGFARFLKNYQQSCLSQYANNQNAAIALRDDNKQLKRLKQIAKKTNVFYELYFQLENEARDAESVGDIILAMEMFNIRRDQLEDQSQETRTEIEGISLGHKNIKVIASRKTKEELQSELEAKERKLLADKELILELQSISQVVLANLTIPMYKKMKANSYFKILKKWNELVGQTNLQALQVWKFLQEEAKDRDIKYFQQ